MRAGIYVAATLVALTANIVAAQSPVRAKADLTCVSAGKTLHYDCIIRISNLRTGEPISGVTLSVSADMPSMPGVHNLQPVKAVEQPEKGIYRARIALDMHGDWAVRLDVSGYVRDRVITVLRFEGDKVTDPKMRPSEPKHKH